jgi:hypothetical protein
MSLSKHMAKHGIDWPKAKGGGAFHKKKLPQPHFDV